LENSNDNASSLEFDDYVGNFDRNVNDQGVQIDCKKTQQDDDETQKENLGIGIDWCHRTNKMMK